MAEEQVIQEELAAAFPSLAGKVRVARARRVFADVPSESIRDVFDHVVTKMQFGILCAITGLDEGPTLGVIYHLAREGGVVLNLHTSLPKEAPVLQTVTARFPAAEMYEREMMDLLGMQVQGLPPGPRYPLPDTWPPGQYPLRKDWNPETLPPVTKAGLATPASSEVDHA